jgi:hypothetical protein
MKIKKEYIGARCWSKLTSSFYTIEENQGELYMKLGIFYIYENDQPKLIKYVDNTKKRKHADSGNGNGIDNNPGAELSI